MSSLSKSDRGIELERGYKQDILILDFETTGINSDIYSPIDIGAVLLDKRDLGIKQVFGSYIRPPIDVVVDEEAMAIHNIELDMLKDEPDNDEVINFFYDLFGTRYYIGGWSVSFDYLYLRKMSILAKKYDTFRKINGKLFEVSDLFADLFAIGAIKSNLTSLDKACRFFGIKRSHSHSAIEDALITAKVYQNGRILLRENYKRNI